MPFDHPAILSKPATPEVEPPLVHGAGGMLGCNNRQNFFHAPPPHTHTLFRIALLKRIIKQLSANWQQQRTVEEWKKKLQSVSTRERENRALSVCSHTHTEAGRI